MKDTGFWDVTPWNTNVSKKAAGCIVTVKEGYFIFNMGVANYFQSTRRHIVEEMLILLLRNFPFTLEVLDNDFNIIFIIFQYICLTSI